MPRNWTEEKKKSRGQVEKEGRIGAVVVFFFFKAMRKQKLDQAYIQEIRQLHTYVCCIPSLMKEILTSTNLHCKNLSVLEKRMNFPIVCYNQQLVVSGEMDNASTKTIL